MTTSVLDEQRKKTSAFLFPEIFIADCRKKI